MTGDKIREVGRGQSRQDHVLNTFYMPSVVSSFICCILSKSFHSNPGRSRWSLMHFLNEETIGQRGQVTSKPIQLVSGRAGTQIQGCVSLHSALTGRLHCSAQDWSHLNLSLTQGTSEVQFQGRVKPSLRCLSKESWKNQSGRKRLEHTCKGPESPGL